MYVCYPGVSLSTASFLAAVGKGAAPLAELKALLH